MPLATAPYFDQLTIGMRFDDAPGLTLTAGHAALHQAILGDRLRLPLDRHLAEEALEIAGQPVHPGLVCDVAIGQSTLATQRVVANLFYRGLVLHRAPVVGDTLRTTTTVEALRTNTPKPGRRPTGLAVLRIRTVDQQDRSVLDFRRCAMLPVGDRDASPIAASFDPPAPLEDGLLRERAAGWRLDRFRALVPGPGVDELVATGAWDVVGGDVVASAPELARLTLNLAMVHHDAAAAGGRRLVYGGHTIGIAAAQLSRALPHLVTILGWHGCDHIGPVHEGDTLRSRVELERADPLPGGGALLHLRVRVHADDPTPRPVLDWRPVGLVA